ncbi:MAG: polysaccharide biosynthesis/export family protein [Planctomycetota bacterium]
MTYSYYAVSKSRFRLLLGILVFGVLSGCQSSSVVIPPATRSDSFIPEQLDLSAGDVVEISFYYTPELNVSQTIRPDGKIALQLIGEVSVQGKTPSELRAELLESYARILKQPDITVLIRSFYERRVYVGGNVMAPGVFDMPGQMTLLEAIIQAGGLNLVQAEVRNIVVIRHEGDQRYGYAVDLGPALQGSESQPFYLRPKDIVYVPQTKIAKVGQWVDQHINQLVPQIGFTFSQVRGDTVIGYNLR